VLHPRFSQSVDGAKDFAIEWRRAPEKSPGGGPGFEV
jgi:hypothetical protein